MAPACSDDGGPGSADIGACLGSAPQAGTAADPVLLPLAINLSGGGWTGLLTAINTAGKFVALDLTNCTMAGTEFDPGTANTGEGKIVTLTLPNMAKSVRAGTSSNPTFKHFSALAEVRGAAILSIDDYAFAACAALASVSFPAATTIGNVAFACCAALTAVSFPAATTIGDDAFAYCAALATVNLPAATTIGDFAFSGLAGLTSVNLPAATNIGKAAFADTGSQALTVTLGAVVPTPGVDMFMGVTVPKTVTVKVPDNENWRGKAGTLSGAGAHWGNGFRGGGGPDLIDNSKINGNISLTVRYRRCKNRG
jgi:hypothetical protein